ncbi:methyltransferase family protein [Pseudonocardia hierapolitana]|uniref:Methyltransferase family protein n=1 Tax=Pseudonocardia hierapolitana TaxID=1128676 RepID=A0A561SMP2_9PSEU|nr:class I SAM-dependent methyltransferase [Pseudonocardia hierapolitana]TWF76134.1 methyltransferase family protein [Pseudonocardia hierapolitana]
MPVPAPSDAARFDAARFDAAADAYDDDPHHLAIARQLVAGLRPVPAPELVVDVATGTGFAALAALETLAPRRVLAIDISPRMIEKAAAKAATDGRVEWRVGPAVPLDLPDGTVDVVLCASALHLIGASAPAEWRRVLRPGGRAAFSIPVAAHFHPSPEFAASLPADLAVPADEEGAERIARAAGFESVRVTTTPAPRRSFLVFADLAA